MILQARTQATTIKMLPDISRSRDIQAMEIA